MRKGSSSLALVRASIGSQAQSWGMSTPQAFHLASGDCGPPPTAEKLQAIYNRPGRGWANISCPFPTPLDLQTVFKLSLGK